MNITIPLLGGVELCSGEGAFISLMVNPRKITKKYE
jgi:hypothetical protein